jgi:type IV pilus assembly protein PilX
MLKRQTLPVPLRRARQRGVVLLIALVVLVAIMIGGIAMMRSVDSATLVAGNLAFQQAATNSADQGVETAIAKLQELSKITNGLNNDDPTRGYFSSMNSQQSPDSGVSWQAFWDGNGLTSQAYKLPTDQAGNDVYFVIHRECSGPGSPGSKGQSCISSPVATTSGGNSEEGGDIALQAASQVYYRITVRVSGPRRTESYVQSHITM